MNAQNDDAHILVVDDDERLRALLQRYLSQNGLRVSVAADAAEARTLLKSMAFDLLILDVMMPGESGLDFAVDLRTRSAVPILMLTAQGDPEHRIAGLERGADDYLAKPFEPRELLLRVEGLLRRTTPVARSAHREVRMGDAVFDPERAMLQKKGKPVHLTSSEAALLAIVRCQCGARVLARRSLRAPRCFAGTLDRRAGHAPAPQDRGRSQDAALPANRAQRRICPCPRQNLLNRADGLWPACIRFAR